MEIGLSKICHKPTPLEDFLQQAKGAGYEVIEMCLTKEGELTPQSSDEEINRIIDLSEQYGLPIVSMTLNTNSGNLLADGEEQRTAIEDAKKGLDVAARMNIGVCLHTLGRLSPDLYYDDAYRNGVAALKEIGKTAEDLGVDFAWEFIWNGFLFSPTEAARFLDEVGSARVGFYFDPGNMAVFQFPQHWARIVGRHIKMMHAKDWKGRAMNGAFTPLLEGDVDFAAVMREVRAAGYDKAIVSEVAPALADIKTTAQAMKKIVAM